MKMPKVSNTQKSLQFLWHKIELNIGLETSSSDSYLDLEDSDSDSDLSMQLTNSDFDAALDSSDDSDDGGDPWKLEGQPRPLFELYFVMDSTHYHCRDQSPESPGNLHGTILPNYQTECSGR